MAHRRPVITLTTDFGSSDGTVGAMMGVIKSICPDAEVLIASSDVPSHDIRRGAWALYQTAPFFPPQTIHVAVVDPGVGSNRRALLAVTAHGFYIGPDNGVLTWAVRAAGEAHWISIENPAYRIATVGVTFDGRDLFAPTAAYLANGVDPGEFGPDISDPVALPWPEPEIGADRIIGEVLVIDKFGNLVTNIPAASALTSLGTPEIQATFGDGLRAKASSSYLGIREGFGLLINGSGLLEIAARERSAAVISGLAPGSPVVVMPAEVSS